MAKADRTPHVGAPARVSGDHAPDGEPTVATVIPEQSAPAIQRPRRRTLTGSGPKWQQIADDLRTQIDNGQLAPGDEIPSEAKLQVHYNVARATVRQAVQALRAAGIVLVEHGRPTRVRPIKGISAQLFSFMPTIERKDDHFRTWDSQGWTVVLDASSYRGEAGRHAEALGVDPSASVFILERQLAHDDTGTEIIHRLYLPFQTVDSVDRNDAPFMAPAELYQSLTEAGNSLHWDDAVTAAMPSPDEAATLEIPDGVPVLIHQRITLAAGGTPLAIEETRLPSDRISLTHPCITAE
jgi:GntR family transcriptional regulator